MTDAEWRVLIQAELARQPPPIELVTYRGKRWSSWSKPAAIADRAGVEYVVKSPRIGPDRAKSLVTEQVVTHLGRLIDAPVPDVCIVDLSPDLIALNAASIGDMGAGVAHGSKRVPDTTERDDNFPQMHLVENRPRYAAVAALYGWTSATDNQFICSQVPPYLVYSVDHGFFFNGPSWTAASLSAGPRSAACDNRTVAGCKLTPDELRPVLARIAAVPATSIAEAVARPPAAFGVTIDDRVAIAEYLEGRQASIATSLP